jgi:hydroxypyruvate isomerase
MSKTSSHKHYCLTRLQVQQSLPTVLESEIVHHHRFALSANVSLLFAELPYLDRFRAARTAGFDYVETWWPFAASSPGAAELDAFLTAVTDAEVGLRGLNFFAGDMPAGERGIACRPERRDELEANLETVLTIAAETGCRHFNLLYGQLDESPLEAQQEAAVQSYRLAAAAVAHLDGVVLIEPLAAGLNGRYPLTDHHQVIDLLTGPLAASANVKLLVDTFHLAANGIDVHKAIEDAAPWTGHVQIADTPGRGEPGSGDLDWAPIFEALQRSGYDGLIAAEYKPTRATLETLDWVVA